MGDVPVFNSGAAFKKTFLVAEFDNSKNVLTIKVARDNSIQSAPLGIIATSHEMSAPTFTTTTSSVTFNFNPLPTGLPIKNHFYSVYDDQNHTLVMEGTTADNSLPLTQGLTSGGVYYANFTATDIYGNKYTKSQTFLLNPNEMSSPDITYSNGTAIFQYKPLPSGVPVKANLLLVYDSTSGDQVGVDLTFGNTSIIPLAANRTYRYEATSVDINQVSYSAEGQFTTMPGSTQDPLYLLERLRQLSQEIDDLAADLITRSKGLEKTHSTNRSVSETGGQRSPHTPTNVIGRDRLLGDNEAHELEGENYGPTSDMTKKYTAPAE